jgi:hypothetical protein
MASVQGGVRFDQIAKKWHALAQRRLAHVREMERSGRWKHLYSEEQFRSHLGEAERGALGQAGGPICGGSKQRRHVSRPLETRVTAAPSSAI